MSNVVIVGAQWGDEGKGKIIDIMAEKMDIIVRYQGGNNAGHTVVANGNEFVFHLLPSGILHSNKLCLIGHGVVFNPEVFFQEIDDLLEKGIEIENRIFVSPNAHLIMPYHIYIDKIQDKKAGIGTTARGIGPAYEDKARRGGIRIGDLLDEDILTEKLIHKIEEINCYLQRWDKHFNLQELKETCLIYGQKLKKYVADTSLMIYQAMKENKNILFEGAQGTLLDIDYGTYPFVTSSNTTAGGSCTGAGVPPTKIDKIIGISKAYSTRVGSGPFPTELTCDAGEDLRLKGKEYGATTGRPRRCGWFDALAVQYSARVNGLTGLIITKLDVLDDLDKIKICTAYRYNDELINEFPYSLKVLREAQPIYEELPGWQEEIKHIRKYQDLPENAKRYLERISDLTGLKIEMVSIGEDRQQIITL